MTRRDETSEFEQPSVVVKHGRIYWSAGVIAVLASGIASFLITRSSVDQLEKRVDRIEALESTIATKSDVKAVGDRVDDLYRILIERQEARPPFPKPAGAP